MFRWWKKRSAPIIWLYFNFKQMKIKKSQRKCSHTYISIFDQRNNETPRIYGKEFIVRNFHYKELPCSRKKPYPLCADNYIVILVFYCSLISIKIKQTTHALMLIPLDSTNYFKDDCHTYTQVKFYSSLTGNCGVSNLYCHFRLNRWRILRIQSLENPPWIQQLENTLSKKLVPSLVHICHLWPIAPRLKVINAQLNNVFINLYLMWKLRTYQTTIAIS